jgi:hypothetical protein
MSLKSMTTKRPKVVKNSSNGSSDKFRKLSRYLESIQGDKFTGYIKINFSQGSIGRIEKFEEILKN